MGEIETHCRDCGKLVRVSPIRFGDAWVATCPLCKRIAVNTKSIVIDGREVNPKSPQQES